MGLLSRSPEVMDKVIDRLTVRSGNAVPAPPTASWKILYPTDWFPMGNEPQQNMVDMFLKLLEQELGVETRRISLEEEWAKSGPEQLRSTTLYEYLDKSIYWPNCHDGFHSWDEFLAEHEAEFSTPTYTSPFMTRRW